LTAVKPGANVTSHSPKRNAKDGPTFVSAHPTNSIHAILKKEIKNYLDAPAPFSTQARMIDGYITEALDIHGLQGQVTVDYTDAPGMTRLD
jgi:hypothetical protein